MFHVEHQGELLLGSAFLDEQVLCYQPERSDGDRQPGLFLKFAEDRRRGRFPRLDVPTGEIAVPPLPVAAEKNMSLRQDRRPRQHLDVVRKWAS